MSGAASYLPEGFEVATSALERSNIFRRRGNELYGKAREITREGSEVNKDFKAMQESMKLYQAAMVEYGKALNFLPNDHRLYANRGLCYKAVEDWVKCREDAQQCIKLRRDYSRGWLLLVKSIWELGKHADAMQELQNGLKAIPGCRDLLDLQAALTSGCHARSAGRSVSPARTPGNTPSVSRSNTPPRHCTPPSRHGTPPPPPPPQSVHAATLPAIDSSGRSPGSRTSSKSPGPGRLPCPPSRVGAVPNLEGSLTVGGGTGNFGVPTPSFAHGQPAFPGEESLVSHQAGGLGASGTFGASTTFGARVGPGPELEDCPKDRSISPGPGAGLDAVHSKRSLKSLSESGRR